MDDTTGRVTPRVEDETDIRTQEIREEIVQTRMEMSETIEAIEERLRPSNLVAQAGQTVKNAATEKVKSMAHTAEDATEWMMDTSVGQTVRSNPIPAAMIGIGTAWLLMNRRSNDTSRRRAQQYSRYRTANAYGGTQSSDWRRNSTGAAVGTSGTTDYGTGNSEFGGDISGYSRDYADRGSYGGGYSGRRTGNFERVVRDNPLIVGAAAALIGAAIGMSLPSSETENRLMGEARDNVVERAREAASEAADKVQDVAGKAADAATQVRDAAARATGDRGPAGRTSTSG